MKITLKDSSLIMKTLTGCSGTDCTGFAEQIEAAITDPETLRLTGKYSVDKRELILIETKPLSSFNTPEKSLLLLKSILKGKRIYFSRLFTNDDCFDFSPPEQVFFKIDEAVCINDKKLAKINKRLHKKEKAADFTKEHYKKINAYLAQINREVITGLITSAKRDYDFVLHYNSEMFLHNLQSKGLTFVKETAAGIYENERYTKIIDLSDTRERIGFMALYAITFHGLSMKDLYSVNGIFSLDLNRETDEKKRKAGQEIFELVFNENREEIHKKVQVMAQALKALPLPEINLNINTLVKQNYCNYLGICDIGQAFSRIIINADRNFEEAVSAAKKLSFYSLLEKHYDAILSNEAYNDGYKRSENYKKLVAFTKVAAGKKLAGDFTKPVK